LAPVRRQNRRRVGEGHEEDGHVTSGLEGEQIPLEDLGGASGGDERLLEPIIHSAPETKAAEVIDKNVPLKKRKEKKAP
jgi:hypothetical protein